MEPVHCRYNSGHFHVKISHRFPIKSPHYCVNLPHNWQKLSHVQEICTCACNNMKRLFIVLRINKNNRLRGNFILEIQRRYLYYNNILLKLSRYGNEPLCNELFEEHCFLSYQEQEARLLMCFKIIIKSF